MSTFLLRGREWYFITPPKKPSAIAHFMKKMVIFPICSPVINKPCWSMKKKNIAAVLVCVIEKADPSSGSLRSKLFLEVTKMPAVTQNNIKWNFRHMLYKLMYTLLHFLKNKNDANFEGGNTSKGLQMRLLRSSHKHTTGQESGLSHPGFAVKNTPGSYFHRQERENLHKYF